MTDKKIFELHADVCKVLGHPLRIEVIDLLQDKELCFTDILEIAGGLKSNLSQHLSVMTKKGDFKIETRWSMYLLFAFLKKSRTSVPTNA
jgi:DNA-binding transcriptional ArsR family regulator